MSYPSFPRSVLLNSPVRLRLFGIYFVRPGHVRCDSACFVRPCHVHCDSACFVQQKTKTKQKISGSMYFCFHNFSSFFLFLIFFQTKSDCCWFPNTETTDRHAHINLQTQSVLSNSFLFNKNKPRRDNSSVKIKSQLFLGLSVLSDNNNKT